jgi:autotransporter-associated beta strand protein
MRPTRRQTFFGPYDVLSAIFIPICLRFVESAILAVLWVLSSTNLQAQIASFPGAVGYGAATTGGWSLTGTNHTGGNVYHVTNLNDSGAGSFRSGVATGGNIVVFDVGGSIQSLSPVSVASNVSIEGQTAPGGIQVFGAETSFYGSSNVICRYIYFRDGTLDPNYPGSNATNSHTNAVNLGDTHNIILDHCSFEFAAYNNIDSAGAVDVTMQNCLFADPIREQQFNLHFETGPVTMIDNLWANSHGRNPLGKGDMQFVNNVVYNYQYAMTTGNSSGDFHWDVVNNYFISGPSTTNANDCYYQVDSNQSAYAIGNYLDGNNNGQLNGNPANTVNNATVLTNYWFPNANETIATTSLPTVSAAAAVYNDISNAGPVPHDQVDEQVVGNVLSLGTQGMLWGNQTSTGLGNDGYGIITSGTALPDSDSSGMPDDWKAAVGISMTNPAAGEVTSPTGYTYLENYLAWKAQPNAWVQKNTAAQPTSVTINLSQYADGFGTSATYAVSNPIKGTVTQSPSQPYMVTFTPTSGTSGLGGFNWTVSNSITAMTSTCGVLISQSGPAQSVIWKGDGVSNYWDTGSSDWTLATTGSSTAFGNGDPVTFNDIGSVTPSINIDAVISPGSITFDNFANNYVLSGTGAMGGTGTLVVEGGGTVTLEDSGPNTFTGGSILNSGTLTINNSAALGSGPLTLNGGSLEMSGGLTITNPTNVNSASTIEIQGGTTYLNGTFSGAGPLMINVGTNGLVCTFGQSWTGFTGTLNIGGTANLRIEGGYGFPNAIVNINGSSNLYTNYGYGVVTYNIGALNGGSTAAIQGNDAGGSGGTTTTYAIGALNIPSVFAGPISNSTSLTAITGTGTSMLTLSGSSTYTGPTSIYDTLLLTGSLGYTPVTIYSGGILIANAVVSGTVTLDQGSAFYLRNSINSSIVGTLYTGGIDVNGGTGAALYYGLSSSPSASSSNDTIVVTSTGASALSLAGTVNFNISLINGTLGAGNYPLITGGGLNVAGLTMNLQMPIPAGGVTRQSFTLGRPASGANPGFVQLTVAGSAGSLTWTGTNGAAWDLNTTADWSGASPATFYDLDSVTFNDMDAKGSVSLSSTLDPNVIYVNNNLTNYTFSGTGAIAGNTELIKSGTASLTVNNSTGNTFTGPIYLNAGTLYAFSELGSGTIYLDGGTLSLNNGDFLGNSVVVQTTSTIYSVNGSNWVANNAGATLSSTGPVTLYIGVANGSAFTVAGNMDQFQGTFEMGLSAGLVRLNGDGSSQAVFDIGASSGTLGNRNGGITVNFGGLEGGPNTTLEGRQGGSGPTTSTYVVGALNQNQTFAGTITNDGDEGGLNLTKVGTGNWTLSGTSNFTGDITIVAGTLTISGSENNGGLDFVTAAGATFALGGGAINTETVQVSSGASFTGYGTIDAAIVNQGVATVTGPLTINGNFENDGSLIVTGSGSLVVNLPTDGSGSFVNNGLLDIMDSPQTVLPAGYENNGTILTSSLVTVKQFSKSGTTFFVQIQSYSGHTYQLQRSTNLNTWVAVGTAQSGVTGTTLTLSDTNAPATGGSFYRIAVGP